MPRFYRSGKLLIQGKEADVWRGLWEVDQQLTPFFEGLSLHPSPPPQIGSVDESGRAITLVHSWSVPFASDALKYRNLVCLVFKIRKPYPIKVLSLADSLKPKFAHQVVKIGPSRYNGCIPNLAI